MGIKLNIFTLAVYATMRNLAKKEALVEAAGCTLGRTLEIKQLDVCDENSIKACVKSLPRVDILSKIIRCTSYKRKCFIAIFNCFGALNNIISINKMLCCILK